MSTDNAIEIQQLQFSWPGAARPLLNIPQLHLASGSSLFIAGPSGCGKSTLLNLVAGVQSGYQGSIQVCGQSLAALRPRQRDQLRADRIGVIFQQFNLLPWLSPRENVVLGCRFSPQRQQRVQARSGSLEAEATRLLAELGLERVADSRQTTASLSIGQQQRVAAARALIGSPPLIIADEPTSALDANHRDRFIDLLLEECRANGSALLFVSHDAALAQHFDGSLHLGDPDHPATGAASC